MWHTDVLDEVALEGLDGITLNTLWIRLENRAGFQLSVQEDRVREYLWRAVLCNPSMSSLSYFTLSTDRPPLVYQDRFQNISPTGMFIEDSPVGTTADSSLNPVSGKSVRGSCKDIDERQDVTGEIYAARSSLSDVMKKYGDKLIAVASQEERNNTLGLSEGDPFMFLSDRVFAFLDLVARRRQQGLATIGADAAIGLDPKTAFYYRKVLLKNRLISKCPFHLVMKGKPHVTKGNIVFLSRFYRKIHRPIETTAAIISDLLLQEEDHECEVIVLRNKVDRSNKRMFNHVFVDFAANFQCFMKEVKEGPAVVKKKVVRLVKPVMLEADENKEENNDEDSDGDDDEAEVGADVSDETLDRARLFDPTRILADRTMLSQIMMAIERSPTGLCLREIGEQFSLTKLDTRLLTKLLMRSGKVSVTKEELGRTRVSRYCSINTLTNANTLIEIAQNDLHLQKLETVLKVRRANIILKVLDQADYNMVFGMIHFVKEIRREESGSGKFCDPKSIRRLLGTLEKECKLRVHEFDNVTDDRRHRIHVVTKPDTARDDPFLKNKVDSYFFRLNTRNPVESRRSNRQFKKDQKSKKSVAEAPDDCCYEYNPSIGRKKYGSQAKMRKIFTLYKFLFHQLSVISSLSTGQIQSYADWRKQIRPMPDHSRRVAIRDLLPRIPVSIFCNIVNITHEVPGLEDVLLDPHTRHIPLNRTSDVITKGLLYGRKYAYNILTLLTCLVDMGLVEVGNADAADKDDVTVKVLNKFTFTHMDSSEQYLFKSVDDIEKMEDDVAMHCQSSCGGCSLPKHLFAHQTRNWHDGPRIKPMHILSLTIPADSGMEISVVTPNEPVSSPCISQSEQPISRERTGGRGKRQRRSGQLPARPRKRNRIGEKQAVAANQHEDNSVILSPRKRRKVLDDKDKHALSILNRRRCIWSQQEDNFLLLCRVATLLLGQENIMYINARLVRDKIHRLIPHSLNKTTNAIRRRILYMMKDHRTRQSVLDWVSEFRQDDAFAEVEVPSAPKTNVSLWNSAFEDAVTKVLSKFAGPRDDRAVNPILHDMSDQSLDSFALVDYVGSDHGMKRSCVFLDPKNCVDIHVNAVENVLISSLILSNGGTLIDQKYSYSLFKIYQRYPDSLIRSVVTKMKKNNIMALSKKNNTQAHSSLKSRGVTPYKLSRHYSFILQTKYAMESLVKEAIDFSRPFCNSEERSDVSAVVSLFTSRSAKFTVAIPEDFIALDRENPFGKTSTKVPRDVLISGDKRCSSRSVLYAFREQLSLNTRQPNDKIQDYLVLNKCGVSVEPAITDPLGKSFHASVRNLISKTVPHKISTISEPDSDLLRFIQSHKELGCTRKEFESHFGDFPNSSLSHLVDSFTVYRVGVDSFRWVHHSFLGPWIVRSACRANPAASDSDDMRQRRESLHDIEYMAKVWRKPNGEAETSIMYKLMAALVGHVMTYPGISQAAILSHFCITAPATQLLELLELLIQSGCISVEIMSVRPESRLFAPIACCSLSGDDDSRHLDDDARAAERFFEVTPNGILILSQIRGEVAQSRATQWAETG